MASVQNVADFFIEVAAKNNGDLMTNLRLNKLLYFAQGHYLARTGEKLFDEAFEAWKLGPVVPVIYHKYKEYGSNPLPVVSDYSSNVFSGSEFTVLLDVAREYGKYATSELVNKSHSPESPWAAAYNGVVFEISTSRMADYFSCQQNSIPSFDEVLPAIAALDTAGVRDADGYLVLPKEDEDGEEWDSI